MEAQNTQEPTTMVERPTIDLNPYIQIVHGNAKEKGWWDNPRKLSTLLALCTSEVSEAVEEARKPAFLSNPGRGMYSLDSDGKPQSFIEWDNGVVVTKPEGEAVELMDFVIRTLDIMGHKGLQFSEPVDIGMDSVILEEMLEEEELKDLLDVESIEEVKTTLAFHHYLNMLTSLVFMTAKEDNGNLSFGLELAVKSVAAYFGVWGWDFKEVLEAKLSYNGTRSFRHGNKVF